MPNNYPEKIKIDPDLIRPDHPTIKTLEIPIKYTLCRAGAYHPKRANPGDAGIDFFVPKHTWKHADNPGICQLEPGARILIPSGVKMDIPAGWAMVFFNKSGIATKYGLVVGAQVVDHGYQGEIHINVINTNNENPVYIDEGDKLVQGVLIPVGLHPLVEVPLEEMFLEEEMIPSTRGDGGFGHTGMDVLSTEPSDKEKQDEEWKDERKQ